MVRKDEFGIPIRKPPAGSARPRSRSRSPERKRERSRSPDRRRDTYSSSKRQEKRSDDRHRSYDRYDRDDRNDRRSYDRDERDDRRKRDDRDRSSYDSRAERGPTTHSSRGELVKPLPSVPAGMPAPPTAGSAPVGAMRMIEVVANDRLGGKVRVKCSPDDTVGDLKKLIAAQKGTKAEKIVLKKWYTIYKDHVTLSDYEIHDGMCAHEMGFAGAKQSHSRTGVSRCIETLYTLPQCISLIALASARLISWW